MKHLASVALGIALAWFLAPALDAFWGVLTIPLHLAGWAP